MLWSKSVELHTACMSKITRQASVGTGKPTINRVWRLPFLLRHELIGLPRRTQVDNRQQT